MLLSLFAATLGSRSLSALSLADRLFEQLRAGYLLRAAAQVAALIVDRDPTPTVDAATDEWSNAPAWFYDRRLGDGIFRVSAPDPSARQTRYGLTDEERRVNLSTAPGDVLEQLLVAVGVGSDEAEEIAAAIEDWRDEDDTKRPRGAESFYYQTLGSPYACKNGPFQQPEELLLVRGMSPGLYRRLEPLVTVYGSGRVNLNTAAPEALRALGLSAEGVRGLLHFRSGEDNREGTADDRVLPSVPSVISELEPYIPLEDVNRLSELNAAQLLAVRSTAFRMHIEAWTEDPRSRLQAWGIMDRGGSLLLWAER